MDTFPHKGRGLENNPPPHRKSVTAHDWSDMNCRVYDQCCPPVCYRTDYVPTRFRLATASTINFEPIHDWPDRCAAKLLRWHQASYLLSSAEKSDS